MKVFKTSVFFLLLFIVITSSRVVETGSTCGAIEDCPDLHKCEENICIHKELFPITGREVGGTIFILILNAIMTAGGVGGGAAYVPYIMLIFQYTLKQSIYIAYACVFGGGLGNLANTIRLKNPKTGRYMINFNVNMIILPALMIGVIIGVLISRMLPPFITNIVLLLVLGFSIYKNSFKLKINLSKERNDRKIRKELELMEQNKVRETDRQAQENPPLTREENNPLSDENIENEGNGPLPENKVGSIPIILDKVTSVSTAPNVTTRESETTSSSNPVEDLRVTKREFLMKKEQRFPFRKIGELLINVIIIVVIGIIRGSKSFDPVVGAAWTCGWDFLWFGIAILAFLLNLTRSVYLVQKWQKEQAQAGYEFLPEDPLLNRNRIIKLVIGSVFAGIIGAIVALGGAIILGPVLLDMQIPPAFSSATTGLFMIFSMFNAMFITILDGRLSWEQLVWFLPLAFLFSFISSKLVNWYVKKTGRQSTVILCVMCGVIIGFVCVLALFIKGIVDDFQLQVKFKSIC